MSDPIYIPEIEEGIPLPASYTHALPELSPAEELDMRVRTMKLLADLSGEPIVPSEKNLLQAKSLAEQMIQDPRTRPDFHKYPNETLAVLAGMVARMNVQIVDDLATMKVYVMNKLVQEAEQAQAAKDRIAALKLLGEIDGVDAFKKRVDMKVEVRNIQEVESRLSKLLDEFGVTEGEFEERTEKKEISGENHPRLENMEV